jgi:DNA-binding NarL/FixJ family response regulator
VIRVLIADDHALVRSALRRCLAVESDIAVVGEAETPEQAVAEARALQPDLVLLDLLFPRAIAYEAIPRIGEVSPITKVIVCSALADSEAVRLALETGAAGYVAKAPLPASSSPLSVSSPAVNAISIRWSPPSSIC